MFLKVSTLISILTMTLLAHSQDAVQNQNKKLQDSLSQMVFPVVQDTLLLDKISIEIDDTSTNLEQGKLEAFGEFFTVPLTSNLGEPIYGALDVNTRLESLENDESFFSAQANLNLELNTLSVFKFLATVFGECEIIDGDNVNNLICIFVTGIKDTNSVSGLTKIFNDIKDFAEDVYADNNEVIAKSLKSLSVSTTTDGNVKASVDLNLSLFDIDLEAEVLITDTKITAEAFGGATVTSEEAEDYKKSVLEYTNELSKEDSDSYTNLQSNLYLVFGFLEAFLYDYDEDI